MTILDMEHLTTGVSSRLLKLKDDYLLGGWVQCLKDAVSTESDDSITLKGIPLAKEQPRRCKEHHKYVSDKRDVTSVCHEVVHSLVEFLAQRFEMDAPLQKLLKPFACLQSEANLGEVHKVLGSDMDLSQFAMEYEEILLLENIGGLQTSTLGEKVRYLSSTEDYRNVATLLARILAAKPHSADVERVISTSTALKSAGRNLLSVEVENNYLYVHHNMPPLMEWDPRMAVDHWMKKREHRVRETPKGAEQVWFKGVFAEASGSSKHGVLDPEEEEPPAQKRRMF